MPTDVTTAQLISQLPLAVVLVLILLFGHKGQWIYGRVHDAILSAEIERRKEAINTANQAIADAVAQRDKWERIALDTIGLARKATDVATSAVVSGKGVTT